MRLLHVAVQSVTRRPLRSGLTALSLILGVLALTSVAAAQEVMRDAITRTALLTGGPPVTSVVAVADAPDAPAVAARWSRSLAERYGPSARVARVLRPSSLRVGVDGAVAADAALLVVDPSLIGVRPFEVVSGSWFGAYRNSLAPSLVLNRAAAAQHSPRAAWTLGWGSVGGLTTAVVLGVVDDGDPSPTVYLDLTQPGRWTADAATGVAAIEVHAPGVDETAVRAALQQSQALAGLEGQTGEVRRTDTVGHLGAELGTTARVFLAVAVVSLTVAAVGLLNIGLSTVAERAEELALRRAFGAHRRSIFALMLLESQLIAVAAGLVAIALAYIAMPVTLAAFGATASDTPFPSTAAALGMAAGLVAATLGALVPAVTAIRMPIASIMRG